MRVAEAIGPGHGQAFLASDDDGWIIDACGSDHISGGCPRTGRSGCAGRRSSWRRSVAPRCVGDRPAGDRWQGCRLGGDPPLHRDRPGRPGPLADEGSPRRIGTEDEKFVLATAATRPRKPSARSPDGACANSPAAWPATRAGSCGVGWERLRQILGEHGICFRRTQTAAWTGRCVLTAGAAFIPRWNSGFSHQLEVAGRARNGRRSAGCGYRAGRRHGDGCNQCRGRRQCEQEP